MPFAIARRAVTRGVVVPVEAFDSARDSMGVFFEPISGIDRSVAALEFVDTSKSIKRAEILERYADLLDKKVLEIGSRFGTNVAAWIPALNTDGYSSLARLLPMYVTVRRISKSWTE